jgi:Do/DeqQ family serine protease
MMNGRGDLTRRRRWVHFGLGSTAGAAVVAVVMGTSVAKTPVMAASAPAAAPVVAARGTMVESYADLVSRVVPAVVTVRSSRSVHQTQLPPGSDDMFRRFFGEGFDSPRMPRRQAGLGSGVVVRDDGFILTNNHVVEGADKVRVDFTDGRSLEAEVVGVDRPSDVAVLKVAGSALPTLPLGDSDRARVGDVVLAIGNPLGVGQTVTMGIVSGKGRQTGATEGAYEDFIQTDAPINQGNSGGALVNLHGELIGINSQILSPVGYNIGIGFAIPSNMAKDVMNQLITKGSVSRGMLGVTVQRLNADLAKSVGLTQVQGAIVSDVTKDGPAAKSGIERGDVILSVNGQSVDSSNNLRNLISRLDPGSMVNLKVWRDGRSRDVTATLDQMPAEKAANGRTTGAKERGRFGMMVEPLTPAIARQLGISERSGVVVSDVEPDGPASEAGIQRGDVIVQVNGKTVQDVEAVKSALSSAPSDRPVLMLVNRQGAHLFLTIQNRG